MDIPFEQAAIRTMIEKGTPLLAHLRRKTFAKDDPLGPMVVEAEAAMRELVSRLAVAEWEARLAERPKDAAPTRNGEG